MAYTTRAMIEQKYGKDNVAKWADLDNSGVEADIEANIDAAIEQADEMEINDRLRGGLYDIPFEDVPLSIQHLSATIAGVILYSARAIDDNAEGSSFKGRLDKCRQWLRDVRAGKIRLDAPITAVNYPMAVSTVIDEDTVEETILWE